MLGVFGDPSVTGKPTGDDLREGKATLLIARARERADAAQLAVLSRIGDPGLSDSDIAAVQDVIRETGALLDAEQNIEGFRNKALGGSEDWGFEPGVLAELVRAADKVTRRVS